MTNPCVYHTTLNVTPLFMKLSAGVLFFTPALKLFNVIPNLKMAGRQARFCGGRQADRLADIS